MAIIFAFDIGYASIGWSALSTNTDSNIEPHFLGTGVVTFPTDDCLASERRTLRRTRRHIRSTRQRIERMKRWLVHRELLSREEVDRPGHPAPFLLAAAAIQGHRVLTAWELWTVLRWYAHNRGYDGNSLWAKDEEDSEDTEKVANARAEMEKRGTSTMCETICTCLDLDAAKSSERISSFLPYKTLNTAYPREIVRSEVGRIISKHIDQIPGLDAQTARLLLTDSELSAADRALLLGADIQLPKRYFGGILFGQLVPRFDNRIIARCPITWATTFDGALKAGKNDQQAKQLADKFAKVPSARCPEFFRFRFAMLLANLKIDEGIPLPKDLRARIWDLAEAQGRVTHKELVGEIKKAGHTPYNLDAYFKLHPDSEDALTLDPVKEFPHKNQIVKALWPALDDDLRDRLVARWSKGGAVTPAEIFKMSGESPAVKTAIDAIFDKDQAGSKKKKSYQTIHDLLSRRLSPAATTGRAPYARPVLKAVVDEVLSGPFHPLKANRVTDPQNGDDKPANGVLYDLGIPTSRIRELRDARPTEQLTNNHLVRHRMLILQRLLTDLMEEFTSEGQSVDQVVVEVGRDLKEFSGMTAKKITAELNSRLKDFKAAVAYLEKNAPHLERSGSLIRKCRIAMDLDWRCPFTGERYDACELPKLEREHIIPYATRNTNALHALVLTYPDVNKMKGKRTARQFIAENQSKPVIGKPNLSLFTLNLYDDFVQKLKVTGHEDDRRRQKARKALLATTDFTDKELGFTEGKLTQSSQLMKLAMGALKKQLPAATIDSVPGAVTGEIRKAWDLMGTLSLACPEVLGPDGKVIPKDEIRGITHLHHALDAATLALAAHYFPLRYRGQDQKGKIWQALLKRSRTEEEKQFLRSLGIFSTYSRPRRDREGKDYTEVDVRLNDLPKGVKNGLARSLAECRVMQHVPSDRSGVKAELTTWGVVSIEGEGDEARVTLRQRTSKVEDGKRVIGQKEDTPRAGKLLGIKPKGGQGKLSDIKGAIIIGQNYGLALDPFPSIIPFHDVSERLQNIREANAGKPVRVLRNGMLIQLTNQGARDGIWSVYTVQASLKIDLVRPGTVGRPKTGAHVWREVSVAGLLKKGLTILPQRYSGYSRTHDAANG